MFRLLFLVRIYNICVKIKSNKPKTESKRSEAQKIIAVMLLHCEYTCESMFGMTACQDWFRYFVACIVIPGVVSLLWMWIETIISMYRNRFFNRARGAVHDAWGHLREKLAEKMTRDDIERYITILSLYGVRYYISKNPKLKELLREMFPEVTDWETEDSKSNRKRKRKK